MALKFWAGFWQELIFATGRDGLIGSFRTQLAVKKYDRSTLNVIDSRLVQSPSVTFLQYF